MTRRARCPAIALRGAEALKTTGSIIETRYPETVLYAILHDLLYLIRNDAVALTVNE